MYARGKFGIEYTPPEPKPESSWLGRVIFVVILAAIALVIRAIWIRITTRSADPALETLPVAPTDAASTNDAPTAHAAAAVVQHPLPAQDYSNRPLKVRNLLLRLAEAERTRDVEMAITTIEQLRTLPGASDLDDSLARKLGAMNFRRLFDLKSAQWVVQVKVKRGDSATRIAYEHGSTFASFVKLNGDNLDKLKIGQVLCVMNHPRFTLVISRRTRTADLLLNGKFFKRYYLTGDVTGKEGSYETPERFRGFCTEQGVPFKPLDRAELEMLLPKGAAAFIKEI